MPLILSRPEESVEDLEKVMNIVEYRQDSTRIRTDPQDLKRCFDLVQSYWVATPMVIL